MFVQKFVRANIKKIPDTHYTNTSMDRLLSNHMQNKVRGKITYPFPNCNRYSLE